MLREMFRPAILTQHRDMRRVRALAAALLLALVRAGVAQVSKDAEPRRTENTASSDAIAKDESNPFREFLRCNDQSSAVRLFASVDPSALKGSDALTYGVFKPCVEMWRNDLLWIGRKWSSLVPRVRVSQEVADSAAHEMTVFASVSLWDENSQYVFVWLESQLKGRPGVALTAIVALRGRLPAKTEGRRDGVFPAQIVDVEREVAAIRKWWASFSFRDAELLIVDKSAVEHLSLIRTPTVFIVKDSKVVARISGGGKHEMEFAMTAVDSLIRDDVPPEAASDGNANVRRRN